MGIAALILESQSTLQQLATFCQTHEGTIYLLSLVVGIFAWSTMMRTAHRRIKSEDWIKHLGWMFFFLGLQYLFLFVHWTTSHTDSPTEPTPTHLGPILFLVLQALSILTNLFGVAAARDIQNRNPLFPDLSKWLRKLRVRKSGQKEHLLPRWCVILAGVSLLASIIPWAVAHSGYVSLFEGLLPLSPSNYPRLYEILGRAPESIFSAICLWWLGYAIFANLSNRRHPWLSLGAVTFAVIYAALQIGFGLTPILSDWLIDKPTHEERAKLFDSFLSGVALPLKIILAYFSYELVARFLETLSDLRKLPDSGFQQKQDYLSSAGVIAAIGERLKDQLSIRERVRKSLSERRALQFLDEHLSVTRTQRDLKGSELRNTNDDATADVDGAPSIGEQFPQRGFVNLAIRLPGENIDQSSGKSIKRVACIFWPNNASEQRPKVFDWKPADHWFSFMKSHEKSEDEEKNRPIITEIRTALPLAGIVLTDEKIRELVWPEDVLELPAETVSYNGAMKAIVSVPIKASAAVIGCLQIGRSKSPFSQMAIRQIREIANLLSPAVQAYRELAGLDLMSIRFAAAQAQEPTYKPKDATKAIAEAVHDIFAPTLTRLSIDFGFSDPILFVKPEPEREHVAEQLEKELKDKEWEDYPADLAAEGEYRLLKKRLTARVTETLSSQPPTKQRDRFIMGSLILAVNYNKDRYDRAALGTTYLHRKMASTLAADAFLDFQRDYYNYILKKLGKELSEKRLNINAWFEPIQKILTEEAGLSWVVARQQKRTLGNEQAICLVRQLRAPFAEHRKSERFDLIRPDRFKLNQKTCNSRHVLVLRLPDAGATIWLGIKREGFGPEVEFASPWKNFLVNFAQIADASLARITFPEKFQTHLEAAQLQGIIASMATTGTVIHQFRNMIAGQRTSLETLLHGIQLGELQGDEEYRDIVEGMYDTSHQMLEMFQSISRLRPKTGGDRRPCQLSEAAEYARRLYEVQLKRMRIEMELQVDEKIYVDVPFTVVALAFATLVGNATDAIREQLAGNSSGSGNGRIEIKAFAEPDEVICQVIDNGPGMSQVNHGKVFEPKRSTKRFGTGMGLYLISHSLSENRSYIELTSSNETGSVFTLKFPPAKKEVVANASNSNTESEADAASKSGADAASKSEVSLSS